MLTYKKKACQIEQEPFGLQPFKNSWQNCETAPESTSTQNVYATAFFLVQSQFGIREGNPSRIVNFWNKQWAVRGRAAAPQRGL